MYQRLYRIALLLVLSRLVEGDSYGSEVILNLNEKIHLFQDCLIHMINYRGINFLPFENPIVLSRYDLILNKDIPEGERIICGQDYCRSDYIAVQFRNPQNSTPIPLSYEHRSLKHRWTCIVQIYLLPPLTDGQPFIDNFKFHIPEHFYNFWNNYINKSSVEENALSFFDKVNTARYHLLIGNFHPILQKPRTKIANWYRGINQLLDFRPTAPADLMVYRTIPVKYVPSQPKQSDLNLFGGGNPVQISGTWLVCKFCSLKIRKLARLDINMSISRTKIDGFFRNLNKRFHPGIQWFAEGALTKARQVGLAFKFDKDNVDWDLLRTAVLPNVSYALDYTRCLNCHKGDSRPANPTFSLDTERLMIMPRKEDYFTFLSCGQGKVSRVSFQGFISPFDLVIWNCVIFFYIGLPPVLKCLESLFSTKLRGVYCGWKIIFEQGDDEVGEAKNLRGMTWIVATWILMSIILTNSYKGENISHVTAPLKHIPYQNFSTLADLNFDIFSRMTNDSYIFSVFPIATTEFINYMISGKKTAPDGRKLSLEQEEYIHMNFRKNGIIKTHPLAKPMLKGLINLTYFDILSKCNNTAIVGWSTDLKVMEEQLFIIRPQGYVSLGTEILFWRKLGWTIYNWVNPQIPRRIHALEESGIARKRDELKRHLEIVKFETKYRKLIEQVTALKIGGNVVVIFALWSFGIGLSLSMFLLEQGVRRITIRGELLSFLYIESRNRWIVKCLEGIWFRCNVILAGLCNLFWKTRVKPFHDA